MITNAVIAHYFALAVPLVNPEAPRAQKDMRSQVNQFLMWLGMHEKGLDGRLLLRYQQHLEQERQLKPGSIRVNLGSIRSWLRKTLRDETFRGHLLRLLSADGQAADLELGALYNHLWEAIDPQVIPSTRSQSDPSQAFCPTAAQMQSLFTRLNIEMLVQLRDSAVIASLGLLGLRETEVCALKVEDLSLYRWGTLTIPDRSGCVAREIPLQEFPETAMLLQRWVREARLEHGALFRGFHRYNAVRENPLSPRGVERILKQYPISMDGEGRILRPLELRRFATRQMAQRGFSLEQMRQRLGVAQVQTVIDYMGQYVLRTADQEALLHLRLEDLKGYKRLNG